MPRNFTGTRKFLKSLAVAALVVAVAGCVARVQIRGNEPDPEKLADLKAGDIGKNEILEIFGSPSSVDVFDGETWYYISERTETVAFFEPEVKERLVLVMKFDKKGLLAKVESIGMEGAKIVEHVERTTPTFGEKLTVLDQILGNFQRFKKKP